MPTDTGYVLYDGPSLFDGERIIVLACCFGQSRPNRKTGRAIQTYIFSAAASPQMTALLGDDRSVCGDCQLRPITSGVCYVELGKGAHWAYKKWSEEGYRRLPSPAVFKGRFVRIGTYGDPAAVPWSVWEQIIAMASNWAGYTHAWRTCDQRLRRACMASVESEADAIAAHELGWRTFRMRKPEDRVMAGEIICPSSDEGGSRRQCESCKACRGEKASSRASSVCIIAHGRPWKLAQLRRLI